jgi:hypothetical protein
LRISLFYHLHSFRRIADLRFTDEQMKVFRHDHVAEHYKPISTTSFVENAKELIAALRSTEPALSLVTTAGDVVEVSGMIVAFQALRHGAMLLCPSLILL